VAGRRSETCWTHGDDDSTFIASARVHSVNGVFSQNCCAACTVASAGMARTAADANVRITALHRRIIQVTVAFLRPHRCGVLRPVYRAVSGARRNSKGSTVGPSVLRESFRNQLGILRESVRVDVEESGTIPALQIKGFWLKSPIFRPARRSGDADSDETGGESSCTWWELRGSPDRRPFCDFQSLEPRLPALVRGRDGRFGVVRRLLREDRPGQLVFRYIATTMEANSHFRLERSAPSLATLRTPRLHRREIVGHNLTSLCWPPQRMLARTLRGHVSRGTPEG
jgi:hypothetical protein